MSLGCTTPMDRKANEVRARERRQAEALAELNRNGIEIDPGASGDQLLLELPTEYGPPESQAMRQQRIAAHANRVQREMSAEDIANVQPLTDLDEAVLLAELEQRPRLSM